MSIFTKKETQNLVIYEIYVRNHSPHGTFKEIESDLARIRSMGVDVIWFMPIHPIGELNKKGDLGCPYSIRDYRDVNPEYGTKQDFVRLIAKAHSLNFKVMIDVVYNHTAHDSKLVLEHPEWFHRSTDGTPESLVDAWSDVVDLNYKNANGLAEYLISCLIDWVKLGVDGFRCDVASIVPMAFWLQAREEVAKINPDIIWVAESVHTSFIDDRRRQNLPAASDCELYSAFDITYDYDLWPIWQAVVQGKSELSRYLEMLRFQDSIYPENFIKLRCVENHDQPRIQKLAPSRAQALAWTAFASFNKGAFLIYAGQEAEEHKQPSLFTRDELDWKQYPLQNYITRLVSIKHSYAIQNGQFMILDEKSVIQAAWISPSENLLGIFNTQRIKGSINVPLPDGKYYDLLNEDQISVTNGNLTAPESAAILSVKSNLTVKPFFSNLLDYHHE